MRSIQLFAAIIFATSMANAAQTVTEQVFQVDKADVIELNGFAGNVTVTGSGSADSQTVKIKIISTIPSAEIRAPSSNTGASSSAVSSATYPRLLAKKINKTVEVNFDKDFSVDEWAGFLASNQWPNTHIEISGAARPLDINWQSGAIAVTGWNERVNVDSPKGSIKILGGEGDLDISSLEASIVVKDRKGSVKVVSHEGEQNMDGVTGTMNLENFAGDLNVEKSTGELNLTTYSGKSAVHSHAGPIQFDSQKAQVTLRGLQDQLRGTNDSGDVLIDADGVSSINIKSKEGLVSLRAPKSGAFVIASSLEGMVSVPNHFEAYRGPDTVQRSGRLRGEQPGRFVIRSEKGQVRVQ
jgi:DUF4097 and DUF4098 domain-containing protein YvlB